MWIYCDICGAIVALIDLHTDWHAARGETPPAPEPDPEPEPAPAPAPAPEEVVTDGNQPT